MTTGTVTPYCSQVTAARESFWRLVHAEWTRLRQSAACGLDPAEISFTGIYPAQAAAAVAGVLAIGNEYSTGMIKLSLTAMPRRLTCSAPLPWNSATHDAVRRVRVRM